MFKLVVLLVLARQAVAHDGPSALSQTMPVYAIASNAHLLNDSACQQQLHVFKQAVDQKKLWSLRILDASGEPKSGFVYGNNYWLGIRSQCFDSMNRDKLLIAEDIIANNSKFRNPEEEYPPFTVNYFVAHFRHNSTLQYHVQLPNEDLVTLGLCLPSSCSTNDIGVTLEKIFQDRSLMINELYDADFKLVEVRDLVDHNHWINGRLIFIGCIITALLGLMIVGTIYDVAIYQKQRKMEKIKERLENNNTNLANGIKYTFENPEASVNKIYYQQSAIGKILLYFSIYTNTKIILDTKLGEDSVPAIHGLRFLGMMWIIMIHTIFYMSDYADNKPWSWRMSDGFMVQIISNSTLSVDTFFFLSGFLVSYMYLKSRNGTEESKPVNYGRKVAEFVVSVLRRFIRLTPAYMMTIGIVELNSGFYSRTSQFYMTERAHDVCAKYWWRNILYINNLFGRDTMCMSWSWYLSNDMQFFIIGTFLLILSSMWFYLSVFILLLLLVGSIIATGVISYLNNYVPTLDEQYKMLDILYDPPWTRIGPYIIGMMTAYIIIKLNNRLHLHKAAIAGVWLLNSGLNVLVLFGLADRNISVVAAAFYVAFSRTLWAISIAWILIACCTNHGGIINKILTFKGFVPLSRLTYCAYLLNPFIISSVYLHAEMSTHIDFLKNGTIFLGNFVSTYCCAYALSLMLETPTVLLMRWIVNRALKR